MPACLNDGLGAGLKEPPKHEYQEGLTHVLHTPMHIITSRAMIEA